MVVLQIKYPYAIGNDIAMRRSLGKMILPVIFSPSLQLLLV